MLILAKHCTYCILTIAFHLYLDVVLYDAVFFFALSLLYISGKTLLCVCVSFLCNCVNGATNEQVSARTECSERFEIFDTVC